MSKRFRSIQQYIDRDPLVAVTSRKVGGVLLTSLKESPNDILIEATRWHSVLMSISGSDLHDARIGDHHRVGPIRRGDVCLVPANIRMKSAWETKGYLLQTFSIEFEASLFQNYSPEVYSDRFAQGTLREANYHQDQSLSSLLVLLARELEDSGQMGRLYTDGLLRLLAFELSARSWSVPARAQSHGSRTDKRVVAAVDYIEANFRQDISLADIAAAAGMSLTHLIDRFRAQTGRTPYAYVIEKRIEAAVQLLRFSDEPISHIAVDSGFADQQHLTRTTQARLGTTPRAIRLGKDRA